MKKNIKITLVTFSPITKKSTGAGQFDLALAEVLHKNKCLRAIICPYYDMNGLSLPKELMIVPPFPLFTKIVFKILTVIGKYKNIKIRRYKEIIFDYFVSKNSILHKSNIVFFTKPAFKLTSQCCVDKKIVSIYFSSILHPRFNNEIVCSEMKRLKINEYSEYADEMRTNYLSSFFATVDHLLVQSTMVKDNYIKYGVGRNNVDVLNSSVNIDLSRYKPNVEYRENDDVFRVLHISNMDLIKGIDYLLSAWNDISLKNAELILGGTIKPSLEKVFEKHTMDNVNILGYVDDTARLYNKADVFVSPSISDLNPFTVLEAMACGLPVIVSSNCGVSSFIEHGVDGFVYQYNAVDELKSHLNWCYMNRAVLKEMGVKARQKMLNCSRNDVFNDIYKYIQKNRTG